MKVLVVGDMCLDIDSVGVFDGYSREVEAMPIFRVSEVHMKGGGAANIATNFARLGAEVTVVGTWDSNYIYSKELHTIMCNEAIIWNMVDWKKNEVFMKYYHIFGIGPGRNTYLLQRSSQSVEIGYAAVHFVLIGIRNICHGLLWGNRVDIIVIRR